MIHEKNEVFMGNIRKWALVFLCAPIFTTLCDAAPRRSTAQDTPNTQMTPDAQTAPDAQIIPAPGGSVDCSSLSPDEQQFAYGLTADNRAMFCGKFTPVQRASAMQLTSQPDPTGALLSPDQAVVKVAGANNVAPQKKSGGGCPVK